ncbi:Protein RFT1 like protein [Argiope bruennichi]|uniref:Protein RFT1 homolog n=1 Tax=Argiope bruennichi TaxID=94029 RepID=A0A8T0EAC7_ARGBR|nr:Protein RFT1 like protein [Argiope bruennichi]
MPETSAVSVAILAASCNIILQVLVRILSSLSNAIIFRFITKEALGVINVRLLLLYSTCHCLSREAFRRSCLSRFDKKSLEKKFNLLWMIIPVCLICSLLLRYIWLNVLEEPDPHLVKHYSAGVNIVIISVLIESLAEPLYVFSQSSQFIKLKVVLEGTMLTVRSLSMVLCLSRWPEQAMYCFCFSQALSSVVYTLSFYGYFGYYLNSSEQKISPLLISSLRDTLPKFSKYFVEWEDLCLTWSFFKQTLLKQLLTEGLTILMFGYSYSQLLLYIYGGTKLSSGIGLTLMRWHCFYVLLLAINGISEGFKFAVMGHSEIDRYNKSLVCLSVGFLIAGYCLVTVFGSSGFIMANCLNMLFRIVHSFHFIQGYFQVPKYWWSRIVPHSSVIQVLIAITIITSISEMYLCCDSIYKWIWHFLLGAACFLAFLSVVWYKENELIRFVYEQWKKKESTESKPKLN